MLYLFLKWLHIVSAAVAIGANFTYGILIGRASKDPSVLPFMLRTVKLIDDRLANPLYVVAAVTGIAMAMLLPIPLTTPWVLASLVLFGLIAVIGIAGYTPALRRQIRILELEGPNSSGYLRAARQGMVLGIALAVLVLVITYLMVAKPMLWQR